MLTVASLVLSNGRWQWILGGVIMFPLAFVAIFAGIIGGIAGSSVASVDGFGPSDGALSDIPAQVLTLYRGAGQEYGLDWTYIAAIGKIETNHGRSSAKGVKSGVNAYGCCAGPMQFMIIGANGGTWGAYGVDGDGDGDKGVYDPADAIPAAAKYLKASGAPGNWRKAIFAYNHATWYVNQVLQIAESYRGAAQSGSLPTGSDVSQGLTGDWLAVVPGTNVKCDSRIVPDVRMLMAKYKMRAGDCFAMSGHRMDGEHPLGLGIDLTPGQGGSWGLLDRLARDLGWRESCGRSGCDGQLPSPFRFVGWNGYPGHGDPSNAGGNAHLHLSWQHTPASPGTPAARVQTLLAAGGRP